MNIVSLDTETLLIRPGLLAPELVCLSWADGTGSGLEHRTTARSKIEATIRKEHSTYANAPFDLGVFGNAHPDLIPDIFQALADDRIHDVQMREKLIDISHGTFRFSEDPETGEAKPKGYSLAQLVFRHFGRLMEKEKYRLRYHDLYYVPLVNWPEGPKKYATTDAIETLEVHLVQDEKRCENACAQVRGHWALHLIEAWGFATDQAAVDTLERRVRDEIEQIVSYLQEAKLVRSDRSRDIKAAKQRMWDLGGRDLTETGEELRIADELKDHKKYLSLNQEACNSVPDEPCLTVASSTAPISVMAAYALYSRLQSLLTGSVKHFRKPVMHCKFDPLKKTGRTGCSAINLQNVRTYPGVRECLRARPGYVLAVADYEMCELRTHAQFCKDTLGFSDLGDALNSGIDVHSKVTSNILHMPYEQYCLERKTDDVLNEFRTLGKAVNFGFPGGCGALRFVDLAKGYGLTITVEEAEKHKALWKNTWTEMPAFFRLISSQTTGDGFYYVYNERAGRLHYRCLYTAACNLTFQGPAADGIKDAMFLISREQFCDKNSPLYGTRMVNEVHDELIVEAPESIGHECAVRLSELMEQGMLRYTPDYPVPAEPLLMYNWNKQAKQIFENGRLVPWVDRP